MAGRGNPGTPITFRRPVFVGGLRQTKSESLGSTSGNMARYGATIITATATGLVYTLAAPRVGDIKPVFVNYTGQTDDLYIACETTAQSFGGSANNTIVVSSSQQALNFLFYGLTTATWGVFWSNIPNTDSTATAFVPYITYSESTVSSSTDRLT